MRKISRILLLFFLSAPLLFGNEPLISKEKAPLTVALPLLKSIDQHAIVIGHGPTHMYAFIDPVCPRSREFVSMIVESVKMQERYTYHFFYYELTRFHSKNLIATIYSAKKPVDMMKMIMVDENNVSALTTFSPEITKEISDIADVAEKLDIYKRPYLFVVKPQKGGQ
jgi:hypothetical protein